VKTLSPPMMHLRAALIIELGHLTLMYMQLENSGSQEQRVNVLKMRAMP
jgi:hypothetical protein